MHEEQGFLDQLRDHPEDDVTRLVYADWLEDRADRRSDYLRAEVVLGRLVVLDEGYANAEASLTSLRDGIDARWVELVGKRWDVIFQGHRSGYKIGAIKLIRGIGAYSLHQIVDLVETAPTVILIAAPRYEAEVARQHLLGSNPLAEVRVRLAPHEDDPPEPLYEAR